MKNLKWLKESSSDSVPVYNKFVRSLEGRKTLNDEKKSHSPEALELKEND